MKSQFLHFRILGLALLTSFFLAHGCASAQSFGNTSNSGLNLQTEPTGTDGQVITFEQTSYELGTYQQGEVVSLEVPFKSTGSEALEVTNVKPSCTCSKLKWTDSPIPPGQDGVMEANIETDDMEPGEKTKYFMFMYDGDPGVERVKVTFVLEASAEEK